MLDLNPVDEKEFFRESTLRICGSLDIKRALLESLNYINQFIPADRLGLSVYENEYNRIRTVAVVAPDGPLTPKTFRYFPPSMRDKVEHYRKNVKSFIISRLSDDELSGHMTSGQNIDSIPMLGLVVHLDEGVWGNVFMHYTPEPGVYTSEHAHLLESLERPFSIALSNYLRYEELQKNRDVLAENYRQCRAELECISGDRVIGWNSGMKTVMDSVRQVAHLDSTCLLYGETGTGKEVVAHEIHNQSSRRNNPFIKVNCGAIPSTLIDSQLFGYEKGAFTGASSRRRGWFERADKGTIFLDEVSELPLEAQVRLLRTLQERVVERVGGSDPIEVDIRVIAASNRDLEVMVDKGLFRRDLYYRLSVFPISIPPLRDRRQDIPLLVQYFIKQKAGRIKLPIIPGLAAGAIDRIMNRDWPGNVRELENAVEREMIRAGGGPLTFEEYPPANGRPAAGYEELAEDSFPKLDDHMAAHIRRALNLTNGRVYGESGAAALLGLNPSTLRHKMNKLGLVYGRKFRS